MDPSTLFQDPLVDLGDEDERLRGIHALRGSAFGAAAGVTSQFLEDAGQYHQRYFDTSYWSWVIGRALERIGDDAKPRTILDIGSGSGNSVFPMAERFPDAQIVATDVSPQLLSILRDFLRGRADAERFALVCVDATQARYRENVADLAIGAAILHHLLEPERVLAACHTALAPGGWALFFEPFQAGNLLLTVTYQRILDHATIVESESAGMRLLDRMVRDYFMRVRPRGDPVFETIDDKWMFTRAYFDRVAREQGWGEVITYALHAAPNGLRNQAEVHLRLGAGLPAEALPAWAWSMLDETDAGMSDDLRLELAQEAAVLLRKPG